MTVTQHAVIKGVILMVVAKFSPGGEMVSAMAFEDGTLRGESGSTGMAGLRAVLEERALVISGLGEGSSWISFEWTTTVNYDWQDYHGPSREPPKETA